MFTWGIISLFCSTKKIFLLTLCHHVRTQFSGELFNLFLMQAFFSDGDNDKFFILCVYKQGPPETIKLSEHYRVLLDIIQFKFF
jgi:hypothetical protein